MPIYKNRQAIKAFKGDYKPVNIYKGNIRITGWEFANVSGETLYVNDTYNDTAYLAILGKTIETGIGEKSPYNPYVFQSVENFDITSTNGDKLSMVTFNYNLRSLPDGTCDYIEIDNVAKTAKLVRNVGEAILNGSENPISTYTYNGLLGCGIHNILPAPYIRAIGICTHENQVGEYYDISGTYMWLGVANRHVYWVGILSYLGIENVSDFRTWLAAQYAAGTPVTVQYKLANPPEPIELDYTAVRTYYPYTNIYTISTVQPTLEAKIRVWEA